MHCSTHDVLQVLVNRLGCYMRMMFIYIHQGAPPTFTFFGLCFFLEPFFLEPFFPPHIDDLLPLLPNSENMLRDLLLLCECERLCERLPAIWYMVVYV